MVASLGNAARSAVRWAPRATRLGGRQSVRSRFIGGGSPTEIAVHWKVRTEVGLWKTLGVCVRSQGGRFQEKKNEKQSGDSAAQCHGAGRARRGCATALRLTTIKIACCNIPVRAGFAARRPMHMMGMNGGASHGHDGTSGVGGDSGFDCS
jgi:hypothetical protein